MSCGNGKAVKRTVTGLLLVAGGHAPGVVVGLFAALPVKAANLVSPLSERRDYDHDSRLQG